MRGSTSATSSSLSACLTNRTLAENRLAALYGLAIASTAPTFFGSSVTLAIELTGAAPGIYGIAAEPEQVRVDFRGSNGKPAMRAELAALVDSLAGRGPEVAEVVDVVDGSVDSVEPLDDLAWFAAADGLTTSRVRRA